MLLPVRALFLLLVLAGVSRATTVEPPSFPELVASADGIYRGHVTAVQARRVEGPGGNSLIKTFVTFTIDRALKGAAQTAVVLEFLGGQVGDDVLEVSGVPQFAVGDREILFVQGNGKQFCPLVAVMHGRYRVAHDDATGRDYVARENRQPLRDASDVSLPMNGLPTALLRAASGASALTPEAFESLIATEVKTPTLQSALP
jgi:hypothetical protein